MLPTDVLASIIGVLVIILTIHWWINVRRYFSLARQIPGLNGLPFVGNILEAISCKYDTLEVIKIIKKHQGEDGIAKFWRAHHLLVLISSPEHLQTFYTHEDLLQRAEGYDTFDVWLGKENILTAGPEQWKRVRKMMVQTFNSMTPEDLMNAMLVEADRFVADLRKLPSNEWVELAHPIVISGYRLFTSVSMDKDLSNHPDLEKAIDCADEFLETIILRVLSPLHFLDLTFPWTKEGQSYFTKTKHLNEVITNYVNKTGDHVNEIIAKGGEPPNRYIFNLLSKYKKEPIADMVNQIISLFGAGVDTTATAIGYTFLMLGMHQDVQGKVYLEDKEIQQKLNGKTMDSTVYQEYEYLERVIKESLRLYPVFPMIGRETKNDVYMGKYLIPKDSTVYATYFWINRDESIHPNAMKFDPDRFNADYFQKLHPYAYTPFSAGIKNCIGSKFAMMSMKSTVAAVVRNFKITSKYQTIEEVEKNMFASVNIHDRGNICVKLVPR